MSAVDHTLAKQIAHGHSARSDVQYRVANELTHSVVRDLTPAFALVEFCAGMQHLGLFGMGGGRGQGEIATSGGIRRRMFFEGISD
jgi:hypothetical protein